MLSKFVRHIKKGSSMSEENAWLHWLHCFMRDKKWKLKMSDRVMFNLGLHGIWTPSYCVIKLKLLRKWKTRSIIFDFIFTYFRVHILYEQKLVTYVLNFLHYVLCCYVTVCWNALRYCYDSMRYDAVHTVWLCDCYVTWGWKTGKRYHIRNPFGKLFHCSNYHDIQPWV